MGLDFDTTERTPLTLKTRTEDGAEATHTFEVLPLTRKRLEKVVAFMRQNEDAGEADAAMGGILAEFCDEVVRSTNGPVTFQLMWDSGELSFAALNQIAQALIREVVGSPPA